MKHLLSITLILHTSFAFGEFRKFSMFDGHITALFYDGKYTRMEHTGQMTILSNEGRHFIMNLIELGNGQDVFSIRNYGMEWCDDFCILEENDGELVFHSIVKEGNKYVRITHRIDTSGFMGLGGGGSPENKGPIEAAGIIVAILAFICGILFPNWCRVDDKDKKE